MYFLSSRFNEFCCSRVHDHGKCREVDDDSNDHIYDFRLEAMKTRKGSTSLDMRNEHRGENHADGMRITKKRYRNTIESVGCNDIDGLIGHTASRDGGRRQDGKGAT